MKIKVFFLLLNFISMMHFLWSIRSNGKHRFVVEVVSITTTDKWGHSTFYCDANLSAMPFLEVFVAASCRLTFPPPPPPNPSSPYIPSNGVCLPIAAICSFFSDTLNKSNTSGRSTSLSFHSLTFDDRIQRTLRLD